MLNSNNCTFFYLEFTQNVRLELVLCFPLLHCLSSAFDWFYYLHVLVCVMCVFTLHVCFCTKIGAIFIGGKSSNTTTTTTTTTTSRAQLLKGKKSSGEIRTAQSLYVSLYVP